MGTLDVEGPAREDFDRIAELVEQYANFPLGGTDASVVALAERLGAHIIITLDRRHFGAIKPRHVDAFELLPYGEVPQRDAIREGSRVHDSEAV